MKRKFKVFILLILGCFSIQTTESKAPSSFRVVGYYCGHTIPIDSFETKHLTHLIYCFGGLQGHRFHLSTAHDTQTIRRMVALKKNHPGLKIMVSLGGWGGCETCSDIFNSEGGRQDFARSVKELASYFNIDGIDLDWEYPGIKGFPGHTFRSEDPSNFTQLVHELRRVNGPSLIISFAAGGFTEYIASSIEWKKVMPDIDFINIMSYDLVHGFSKTSGHHTPLYSTPQQIESTDHAVQLLLKAGVPSTQLVIGAAFYGRFFHIDEGHKVDLYKPCTFSHTFSFNHINDSISDERGFVKKWDVQANAPYAVNEKRRLLATYDNEQSIALKTKYAIKHNLGGIMFWQLYDDRFQQGLLDVISKNKE